LGRSRSALIGGSIVLAVVLVALIAPVLSPFDPQEIEVPRRLLGPSHSHFFGTDNMGRDIFSRVVYGARVSLLVGSLVVACAIGAGAALGLIAGYSNRLDRILMRIMDGDSVSTTCSRLR
jgi:peptide/nickel transport system permease protein